MKLKITGYTDNTYSKIATIEVENVMGLKCNADDKFIVVGYEENGQPKEHHFASLQWAMGAEITP